MKGTTTKSFFYAIEQLEILTNNRNAMIGSQNSIFMKN